MIAKHYKNYYVAPLVSFTGFIYYLIWRILKSNYSYKYLNYLSAIILIFLIIVPFRIIIPKYKRKVIAKQNKYMFAEYCVNNISKNDYVLIEPTWMSGPIVENGLVFGLTYAIKNHLYYNSVEKYYPNILSWEGENNPFKFFWMLKANSQTILKSGRNIFILSTPGRNAQLLCDKIKKESDIFGIDFKKDTVFSNAIRSEYLIKYINTSNWKTVNKGYCGFEKFYNGLAYTNDERISLKGPFLISHHFACNGNQSLMLNNKHRASPSFTITEVSKGDYLEFTIKHTIHNGLNNENEQFILSIESNNSDSLVKTEFYKSKEIKPGWIFQRVSVEIIGDPADEIISCLFQYSGVNEIYIDDFSFKHFSENK